MLLALFYIQINRKKAANKQAIQTAQQHAEAKAAATNANSQTDNSQGAQTGQH